jgi:hypothetical protein
MDEWTEEDSAWFKSERVEKTVPNLEGSDFHFRHLLFPHLLKKSCHLREAPAEINPLDEGTTCRGTNLSDTCDLSYFAHGRQDLSSNFVVVLVGICLLEVLLTLGPIPYTSRASR